MKNVRPSDDQILALHKKFAQSAQMFEVVYTHCQIVWRIAEQLIRTHYLDVDEELVRVGCLLHDIGAYQFNEHGTEYIQHGIIGEDLLKSEGLPEEIYRIASHHTGLGLTKEHIIKAFLPLPHVDLSPASKEERLVLYADKFHSKSNPPRFNSFQSYKDFVASLDGTDGEYMQKFDTLADEFGLPELTELAIEYGYDIK